MSVLWEVAAMIIGRSGEYKMVAVIALGEDPTEELMKRGEWQVYVTCIVIEDTV